jgi:tetratricopeptide (TPR) repeat protein
MATSAPALTRHPGTRGARVAAIVCACTVALTSAVFAQPAAIGDCGDPFTNAYGPFDYRTATKAQKAIVEANHFTPAVESLKAGITGHIGGELDYTLRAFPNHPRALMAMIRLSQRDRTTRPQGALYPVACYVERAVQFRPDDPNVRQIRGIFLSMLGRHQDAIADFRFAVEQSPNDAGAHYNLGLAYFETKQYDLAVEEAKIARSLGHPLAGLTNKLKSAGKRVD